MRQAGSTPFWEAVHQSKDPTTYTVLAEGAAALAGLAIAAVGITLSHRLDMPSLDGAASVVIGLLLAGMATLLTGGSRDLLIGKGIRPDMAQAIRDLALAQPSVRDVGRVLSMYGGPNDVLVTMHLDFDTGTDAAEAAAAIGNVERQVRERVPKIRRLFIESGSGPVQQRWSRPDADRPPSKHQPPQGPHRPCPVLRKQYPSRPADMSISKRGVVSDSLVTYFIPVLVDRRRCRLRRHRGRSQACAKAEVRRYKLCRQNELASIQICVPPYRGMYTRCEIIGPSMARR